MKFLHLSDLHLGKRMNEYSLLEDQKAILAQILSVVDSEKPSGVIIAGDIYDKPIPPAEAVQLLDEFLTQLSKRKTKIFIISGNHDSAQRLAFGARLFDMQQVYVSPVYDGTIKGIPMSDEHGPLWVWLLPFLRPSSVRQAFPDEEIDSFEDAVKIAMDHLRASDEFDPSARNVLVAHHFVTGAGRCESEEVFVGGSDQVSAEAFDGFDYVALGHLHSPQAVGKETIRYCGTPLKYSFSEADQEKSVTVAELKEKGKVEIRTIPLTPIHDVIKIRGAYMEVTDREFYKDMNLDDYVEITLTDEEDIPGGMQKLRAIYKNLMRLKYDNTRTRKKRELYGDEIERELPKSELEMMEEFFERRNNRPMSKEQRTLMAWAINLLKEEENEI